MSYDNLSSVSQNVLKFYQQLTGEERRIPLIFDDFHFCLSRVIGHDMTENRIFTLCHMITWVVFHRMFWNFISSLPVKRGGSLSFLVGTISNVLVMEIGWTDVGSGGYILVSCAHSNTSFNSFQEWENPRCLNKVAKIGHSHLMEENISLMVNKLFRNSLFQPPRYNWNIVESDVKHHKLTLIPFSGKKKLFPLNRYNLWPQKK